MEKQDFTRNRKQPFCATLLFMFNLLKRSLAIEIDGFVCHLNEKLSSGRTLYFTTSAFIQNRKKIKPGVFNYLSAVIIENFYTTDNSNLKALKGFRVLAVDGSRITLPFTTALKNRYGVSKNQSQTEVVQARASVLYDVLNHMVLDAALDNLDQGERELALRHTHQWKENDLIIYDRGYPSYDFIHEHLRLNIDCLIRISTSYNSIVNDFVAQDKKSILIKIYPNGRKSIKDKEYDKNSSILVRLLRIELSSGEVEVLMTTLLDSQKYPATLFKELYFLRWGVETFYDRLKNKLKVEHFTGYSEVSIQQDFFCAIFISNLQSVIVNDLQDELTVQNKRRQHDYKVNTNLSYGFLKDRILELLYKEAPLERIVHELEGLFLNHTIPIRMNRSNNRNVGKYRCRTKPKVTKNQRDAI